jgi:hypothetical protein
MVYTLNMFGKGRCLDRVVRGLDLKRDSGMRLFKNKDGVHFGYVGQGTLPGQGCQGLGPIKGQWHEGIAYK